MNAINDVIAPARPAMPIVSRVIHSSGRYNACITRAGLIVQSHRTGSGRLMPTNHSQFRDYVEAIETAIDSQEADDICKALHKG